MKNLENYIPEVTTILQDCGIPYGNVVSVEPNSRFRARWGDCTYNRITGEFRIRISTYLLEDDIPDRALLDTLLHEYLHTCPECQNHGAVWKRYAAKINARYGYAIKRINSEKEKEVPEGRIQHRHMERKYQLQCCGCGKIIRYARRTGTYMSPGRYRCATCGGKLQRAV